ncbi:MAG: sugar phosphate isomerase/epimerase [Spirochaetia bacterium]|nr:sugar phosphate isomerase/epimerase [Spirochaetia bacterium]
MIYSPVFGAVCYYEFTGDLPDFIDTSAELGLRWVEFKYGEELIKRGRSRDFGEIRRRLEQSGMGISIHSPFEQINLASLDRRTREESVRRIARSFDYALEVGANQATVHGGDMRSCDYTDTAWADSVKANIESFQELTEYARGIGVTVCLENGNAYERHMLKHAIYHGEMRHIRSQVAEDLAFTVDFGHALYFSRRPSHLIGDLGQQQVRMAHLHDNDGLFDSHNALGTGILDLRGLLEVMYRDHWAFPVCLEIKTAEGLRSSVELLNRTWEEMKDRL